MYWTQVHLLHWLPTQGYMDVKIRDNSPLINCKRYPTVHIAIQVSQYTLVEFTSKWWYWQLWFEQIESKALSWETDWTLQEVDSAYIHMCKAVYCVCVCWSENRDIAFGFNANTAEALCYGYAPEHSPLSQLHVADQFPWVLLKKVKNGKKVLCYQLKI